MSRRRKIITLLGCGLLVMAIVFFFRDREPSYEGHPLSDWIKILSRTDASNLETAHAGIAIRQIGTNAIPLLLQWIQYEQSDTKQEWLDRINTPIEWIHDKLNAEIDWSIEDHAAKRAWNSIAAFGVLGGHADLAVPTLATLLNDTQQPAIAYRAAGALAYLGKPGVPALKAALEGKVSDTRAIVLSRISQLGTNAQPVVPVLIHILVTGGDDLKPLRLTQVKAPNVAAARALGQLKIEPDTVVPALVERLSSEDAHLCFFSVQALGRYGPLARGAIPALTNLLFSSVPEVRYAATNSLHHIDPQTFTNAGLPQFQPPSPALR